MTREALLNHVPLPPNQADPVDGTMPPAEAAVRYESLLRGFFAGKSPRFDLVFLGLGEDGHTASLFPGHIGRAGEQRWAVDVDVPAQDLHRVTLTTPILNQGRVVAFLVSGAAKADILKEIVEGAAGEARYPSQLIRPEGGELRWLLDEAAAAKLKK